MEEYLREAEINAFQTAMSQSKQCAYCVLGVVFLGCFVTLQPSAGYICIKRACAHIFWEDLGEENMLNKGEVDQKAICPFLWDVL